MGITEICLVSRSPSVTRKIADSVKFHERRDHWAERKREGENEIKAGIIGQRVKLRENKNRVLGGKIKI